MGPLKMHGSLERRKLIVPHKDPVKLSQGSLVTSHWDLEILTVLTSKFSVLLGVKNARPSVFTIPAFLGFAVWPQTMD